MANEQSGSPLRRWRPFYGAFGAIDSAIEAAGGHPRSAFREVRVRIVTLLRGAADDDSGGGGGVAEQLCAALQTLRVAPVPHGALASSSSTDLASAVGSLANHPGSARIRSLAHDVVRGWKAAGYVNELSVSGDPIPRQGISTAIADGNAKLLHKPPAAKTLPAAAVVVHKKKLHIPPPKMLPTAAAIEVHKKELELFIPPAKLLPTATAIATEEHKRPAVAQSEKSEAKKPMPIVAQSGKMETTKRKLREGYEEAKRIKRQHTIQKINDKEAAKMFEQKQRKLHPIVRGRSPAMCRTSSGVRRSLLPSLQMI